MGTLDIEFERDWSVGLSAPLGDGHTDFFFFQFQGFFRKKADSVILLSFECTINPQNSIKFVVAI